MEALEAIEIPVKRTYQKHKTGGVISVFHFPNTKIKPILIDGVETFPVYIRITVKKQVTTIKSLILGTYKVGENSILENESNKSVIELETKIIKDFIERCNPFQRTDFHISEISNFHAELYKSFHYLYLESTTDWVGEILEKYAEENKIDEKLFMSVILLNKNTVFTVMRAFKQFIPILEALYLMPNYSLNNILTEFISDKNLYKEVIKKGIVDKNIFIRLNNHHFMDLRIPHFIQK